MARYIDKDKLIQELSVIQNRPVSSAMKIIRDMPIEEVTPIVRGKWITVPIEPYSIRTRTYCSVCKHGQQQKGYKKYCGYCGAKMEESGEE